jgi:anthranilate phosphoribosyltransferase
LKELTAQLEHRIDLTLEQAHEAAMLLADPQFPEDEKADFLIALKLKGETGDEVGYFAQTFLDLAVHPDLKKGDGPVIDVCGTGGDRLELINVSTTTMFLLAAAGVQVAKHGNRAITSKSGGADVLAALGVPIDCSPDQVADCFEATGMAFFFAPNFHPAFRVVAPIRKRLAGRGIATIFNLLGPLLNPARPTCQLVGVFSPTILEKYAIALRRLGRRRAWVVHGSVPDGNGMDEVSILGETEVEEVRGDSVNHFTLFPEELGLAQSSLHELRGGDGVHNAAILEAILAGKETGPKRDFVLANAAAGLVVAGICQRMSTALDRARELITTGAALAKLRELQEFFSALRAHSG